MFGFDPIGEVVDMFGLGLLRWVRESEVRQKLLIEKGSVLEGEATDGKRKGIREGTDAWHRGQAKRAGMFPNG